MGRDVLMKFMSLIVCSLLVATSLPAQTRLDSLLNELDNVIVKEKEYTVRKENYLDNLKEQLRNQNLPKESQYSIFQSLAHEYETFICDSAIAYATRALDMAINLQNAGWVNDSKIQLARGEAKAGMFSKTIDILNSISREDLKHHQLIDYYKTYIDVYIYMIEYNDGYDLADLIVKKEICQDSLIQIADTATFEYATRYGFRCIETGELATAERILLSYYPKVKQDTKECAEITSILSFLYERMENKEKAKEYLAISAISDIRASVKENISLRALAFVLFNSDVDINRANQYIKKSLDDANFYNARLRNIQTAKMLPIIDKAYQLDRERQRDRLRILLATVSVLSIILLVVILFVVKQMKKLAKAKKHIEEINARLNELNVALQDVNKQLKQMNLSLAESNHIKELFISSFLEICTEYIEKLDAFKGTVNRKVKAGQITDILKLTSKTENSVLELKELYANFDNAFLNIYPSFVEEFNRLLRPEERYPAIGDKSLNQELRVFALIKLGVKDINKIAVFLHYTPRTVYNYRSKIKSKALNMDEDFEEKVKRLCQDSF
ncbi:DUF6377 domain-containing protein [Bacteroides sp.]|uniref:DUF6377 domain-containing protein n=1 Tax=Bacteroides sp. TaxID=29523 RepID=UPI0025C554DF|nr:DUF6377 domain-containing protein [Bacteroides sp.]